MEGGSGMRLDLLRVRRSLRLRIIGVSDVIEWHRL